MKKGRKIVRTPEEQAIFRIRIIRGQVESIEKQIKAGDPCIDIITRNLAVQRSLSSLNKTILSHHIETRMSDMIASGDEAQREKAVKELIQLYDLSNLRGIN